MSGIDGGYLRANRIARGILDEKIRESTGIIRSSELANHLNSLKDSRSFTAGRVGCLIREREDIVRVGPGRWRKVEA